MRKHFVLLLVLVLCITLLSGCGAKERSAPHVYEDLTIRLPITFLDLSDTTYGAEYDFLWGMEPITVSGLRDDKSLFEAYNLNLEGYGMLVMVVNGLECTLSQTDGIWNFSYEADGYTYLVTLRETEKAFWTVQAYCPTEDYPQEKDQMWEILRSVTK